MSKPWYKDWAQDAWADFAVPGGAVPANMALVIVVRHGERLDEVDKQAWRRMKQAQPQYFHDPPLTDQGIAQAARAGAGLAMELQGVETSIFASPSVRTLATAAQIGMALELPVHPMLGLYCCSSAAQNYGVKKLQLRDPTDPEFIRACAANVGQDCASPGGTRWQGFARGADVAWPPEGNPKLLSANRNTAFVDTIQELATRGMGRANVLVVHREGFYDPDLLSGVDYEMPPYCGVSRYLVDPVNIRWMKVDPGGWGLPQDDADTRTLSRATTTSLCPADEPRLIPEMPTDELQKAFNVGFGWVVMDRKQGTMTTCLWKDPGRRGDWVDDAGVPAGEVVEIIRGLVSDPTEGDYVEVQRRSGQTGYAKVKNLWMPDIVRGEGRAFIVGAAVMTLAFDALEAIPMAEGTEVDLLALHDELALVELRDHPGLRGYVRLTSLARGAGDDDDDDDDDEDKETDSGEAWLSRVAETLLVCRTDGVASSLMWLSPGLRGPPWAPGGGVSNGEVVTVLDGQVVTDAEEGRFVKVRRASGHEGYLKVKNLHVPLQQGFEEAFLRFAASGQRVLHCRSNNGTTTSGLWRLPGQDRGRWTGMAKPGELVVVIEGPVSSPSEGDFMLVQRHNGTRGWLKVKNAHIPLVVWLGSQEA